ncbi:MAG: TIGR03960 family B12-binding radical SAM protein [Spirochaetia bacterium]|nr:TIGR03960 family B12-binding radical SAM protein [Spirochaetia bacterium]
MKLIQPYKDLRSTLLDIPHPARYVGGEYGVQKKLQNYDEKYLKDKFLVGICYPDLYEIGMSNLAVKILYNQINLLNNFICDRVFTPDIAFFESLKENNISLYTLENGIQLHDLDILSFTIGYELSASNILMTLESGNIPIKAADRTEDHPVILAGGPAVTNPIPFQDFIDAFFIGESEDVFTKTLKDLYTIRKQTENSGNQRKEILKYLSEHDNFYLKGKKKKTIRAVDNDFSSRKQKKDYFAVPSLKTIQDHGVVEIMRGCPNGCRFCHAGIFYRPFRQIDPEIIFERTYQLINDGGYDNITLSSLSSGDYENLHEVVNGLNQVFSDAHVSFSLPSLRVTSFTLPLLEEVSKGKKSGLTFAIETPSEKNQRSINKAVSKKQILAILQDAKNRGWQSAKFYFMIGLPFEDLSKTADEIVSYISEIKRTIGIKINVNIGTFIPKPHSIFQWAGQLSAEKALSILQDIKHRFHGTGVKINYHDPYISQLEGLISRGNSRVGAIIERAYKLGARLDAWNEYFDKTIWQQAIEEKGFSIQEFFQEKKIDSASQNNAALPWEHIDLGVHPTFLKNEYQKAKDGFFTSICSSYPCDHACGACNTKNHIVKSHISPEKMHNLKEIYANKLLSPYQENKVEQRYLVRFEKTGNSIFLSHINVLNVFEKFFRRSRIHLAYKNGFNPKPKITFAHPLSLGLETLSDYMMFSSKAELDCNDDALIKHLNKNLPEGIRIKQMFKINNQKKISLMEMYGGSIYSLKDNPWELQNSKKQDSIQDILRLIIEFPNVKQIEKNDGRVIVKVDKNMPGQKDLLKIGAEFLEKYTFIKIFEPIRLDTLDKSGDSFSELYKKFS